MIIGWIIGLFSGFFSYIGFDIWKRNREKSQLKDLIKQELTEIRSELDLHLKSIKGDEIQGKSYRRSVFNALQSDILRKLNVGVSRQIEITYSEISQLGANSLRGKCEEVVNSIDKTIKILDS